MHFKFITLVISLTTLISSDAFGESKKEELPAEMPVFLQSITKLQPFMISDQEFANPANEAKIAAELRTLAEFSQRLPHGSRISDPLLKKAAVNIGTHFSDLSQAFGVSKTYARYLLHSTLNGCNTCHSQFSGSKKPILGFNTKELKGTPFQKAEFLFTIRQFPEAIKIYEEVMKADRLSEKRNAFLRGLTIYLVYHGDLAKAESWAKAYPLKHDDDAAYVQTYIDTLKALKNEKAPHAETASSTEIESFAEKAMAKSSADNITRKLYTSGVLHKYVIAQSSASKSPSASVYYWLGQVDSALRSNYIFSLVDDYFTQCIDLAPKSAIAKKCMSELEKNQLLSFTGSGGLHVPEKQANYLNSYREKAGMSSKKYPK